MRIRIVVLLSLLAACGETASPGAATEGAAPQSAAVPLEEATQLDGVETLAVEGNTAAHSAPREMEPPATGVAQSTHWRDGEEPVRGERYASLPEHGFVSPERQPLSTFGIDVDAASYSNVRRFLDRGALPPAEAVRIEELVNYFDYAYPNPADGRPFSVTAEVGAAPWNPRNRLVHVGLQGRRLGSERIPPGNLVFLVDVSGSMADADKLPLVRASLRILAERLRRQDRVSIVTYAGEAGVVLPSTSGAERERIVDAIESLSAGGGTNGEGGIRVAYETARRNFIPGGNNRVILATDGDFNVGASSDDELVRIVEREREHGVALTVLGFGTGNLQDARMEALADRGNGNYAYIDDEAEARKALVEEMEGTLHTVARDVKVQVEFDPARVRRYRLIGYENRALAARDFADDRRDAGEMGAGHSVTALYEVEPRGTPGGGTLLTVRLRYKELSGVHSRALERVVTDRGGPASDDFRFAAAVAEWGMLLRGSEHRGQASFERVLERAAAARGADLKGHRAGFLRLVEASQGVKRGSAANK